MAELALIRGDSEIPARAVIPTAWVLLYECHGAGVCRVHPELNGEIVRSEIARVGWTGHFRRCTVEIETRSDFTLLVRQRWRTGRGDRVADVRAFIQVRRRRVGLCRDDRDWECGRRKHVSRGP